MTTTEALIEAEAEFKRRKRLRDIEAKTEAIAAEEACPISKVIKATARAFGVTAADIKGTSMRYEVSGPRMVSILICHELTQASQTTIASKYQGHIAKTMSRSTVSNACRAVKDRIETDELFRLKYEYAVQLATDALRQTLTQNQKGKEG